MSFSDVGLDLVLRRFPTQSVLQTLLSLFKLILEFFAHISSPSKLPSYVAPSFSIRFD